MSRRNVLQAAFGSVDGKDNNLVSEEKLLPAMEALQKDIDTIDEINKSIASLESHYTKEDFAAFEEVFQVTYSPETLSATLKTFVQNLIRFIKAFWDRFTVFIENCFSTSRLVMFKAHRTRYRFRTIEGRLPVEGHVQMGNLTRILSMPGMQAGRDDGIDLGLKELKIEYKFVTERYIPFIEHIGGKLVQMFHSELSHPTSGTEFLSKLNSAMKENKLFNLHHAMVRTWRLMDPIYPQESARRGPFLLGGRTLAFVDGHAGFKPEDMEDPVMLATGLQDSKVTLHLLPSKDIEPATMEVVPHHNLDDWIRYVEELMDMVQKFLSSTVRQQALNHSKTLTGITELMSEKFENNLEYRRAFRYGQAYATWVVSPATDISNHVVRVSDSTLSLINRHIAFYNQPK